MEEKRKNLKIMSILMLVLAAFSLVQLVVELMFGELNAAEIPAGSPENILLITKMVLVGAALVFLVPQTYIGIKGLRIAKNPNSSKGHIVWAKILFVFAAMCLISPVTGLVQQGTGYGHVGTLADIVLEMCIYFIYIMYATAVQKGIDQPAE